LISEKSCFKNELLEEKNEQMYDINITSI